MVFEGLLDRPLLIAGLVLVASGVVDLIVAARRVAPGAARPIARLIGTASLVLGGVLILLGWE